MLRTWWREKENVVAACQNLVQTVVQFLQQSLNQFELFFIQS
jgi:hypothetical protein